MAWSEAARKAALEARRSRVNLGIPRLDQHGVETAPAGKTTEELPQHYVFVGGKLAGKVKQFGTETYGQNSAGIRHNVKATKRWATEHADGEGANYGVKHSSKKAAVHSLVRHHVVDRKLAESIYAPEHPPIKKKDTNPRSNWVERAGGLPSTIDAIARALISERKYETGRAIATAVNQVRKGCASGRVFGGKVKLKPETRAMYCKAAAEWEAKKKAGKVKEGVSAIAFSGRDLDAIYETAEAALLQLQADVGGRGILAEYLASDEPHDAVAEAATWLAVLDGAQGGLRPTAAWEPLMEALGDFTERLHPRARGGKFAKKGGGLGLSLDKPDVKASRVASVPDGPRSAGVKKIAPDVGPTKADIKPDKDGVHHVGSDVEKAAELLGQGKKVSLNQPREVSTLVDKLAEQVNAAREKGGPMPNFNLCNVTVKKTSLFCVESKNIPRIKMPQLGGVPTPGTKADKLPKNEKGEVVLTDLFREMLTGKGRKVTNETEKASYLKASQCHDDQTETLTEVGWLGLDDLKRMEAQGSLPRLASLDPITSCIRYDAPLSGLLRYDYAGPILHFTGQSFDMAVTPNHRMLVCAPGTTSSHRFVRADGFLALRKTRRYAAMAAELGLDGGTRVESFSIPTYPVVGKGLGRRKGEYLAERNQQIRALAETVAVSSFAPELCVCGCGSPARGRRGFAAPGHSGRRGYYGRVAVESGVSRETVRRILEDPTCEYSERRRSRRAGPKMRPEVEVPMDAWLEWLGWYIAEGANAGVSQSLKSPWLREIKRACKALGVESGECVSAGGQWFWYPKNPGQWNVWLRDNCGGVAREKRIPAFVFDLPQEQQMLLLRGLMRGDGSTGGRSDWETGGASHLTTTSEALADDTQRLALHCGFFALKQRGDTYQTKRGERTGWLVRLRKGKSGGRGRGYATTACYPRPVEREYVGEVYCFSMPAGTLITRRNGMIAIQGNSELNGGKVAGMAKVLGSGKELGGDPRLFVSSDNYIVDGHHRWAAKVAHDASDNKLGDVEMPVARVDMSIIELLAEANRFAAEMGIPQADVKKEAPR